MNAVNFRVLARVTQVALVVLLAAPPIASAQEPAQRGRRDPFQPQVTPETPPPPEPPRIPDFGAEPTAADRAVLDELLAGARTALADMRAIAARLPNAPAERDLALRAPHDRLLQAARLLEGVAAASAGDRAEMGRLVDAAHRLYDDGGDRLERLRAEAQDLFAIGRFADVANRRTEADAIVNRVNQNGGRLTRRQEDDWRELGLLAGRANLRAQFARQCPHILGIVYHLVPAELPFRVGIEVVGERMDVEATLRLPVPRSSCFLGLGDRVEVKTVGDEFGGAGGPRVSWIQRDAVVFNFRGELIEVRK